MQRQPPPPVPQDPGRGELGYDPERTLEQVLMEGSDGIANNDGGGQRGITGVGDGNNGANPGTLWNQHMRQTSRRLVDQR